MVEIILDPHWEVSSASIQWTMIYEVKSRFGWRVSRFFPFLIEEEKEKEKSQSSESLNCKRRKLNESLERSEQGEKEIGMEQINERRIEG